MRRIALAVIACALLGAGTAAPATAHTGQDGGTSCAGITLELAGFPAGENTVTTTITVDGVAIDPVLSTFEGPAATLLVALPPFTGTRVVRYQTSWTVDGGGQTPIAETTITCDGEQTRFGTNGRCMYRARSRPPRMKGPAWRLRLVPIEQGRSGERRMRG